MQILDENTKFAHLGKPGGAFTPGFRRRLGKLTKVIDLRDKKILDVGTGEGVWLAEFAKFTALENVFGSEFDPEQVVAIKSENVLGMSAELLASNIKNCPAEALDFPDNTFDIVFSHEVMEHVQDDRQAAAEAMRVLKSGGVFVIFTPNRLWPFEQHGMFWRGKYYWGNIPFLTWFPFLHKRLAPHVRAYSHGQLRGLFENLDAKVVYHSYVFPAFDRLARKWGFFGKLIQQFFYLLERTPLRVFGISHFMVVEKRGSGLAD